ncbi:tautomerase family protein [Kordia sp.]|uniref:tautomerase family protein n=1 Tax=Kordia sp. TaxID=1965332 RepID=UPI003B5A35BD
MPYINIKVTDENVTKEEKRLLIEGATQLMVDILNKDPYTTHVVIEEIPMGNWGHDGKQYLGTKKSKNEQ